MTAGCQLPTCTFVILHPLQISELARSCYDICESQSVPRHLKCLAKPVVTRIRTVDATNLLAITNVDVTTQLAPRSLFGLCVLSLTLTMVILYTLLCFLSFLLLDLFAGVYRRGYSLPLLWKAVYARGMCVFITISAVSGLQTARNLFKTRILIFRFKMMFNTCVAMHFECLPSNHQQLLPVNTKNKHPV